MIREGLVKKTTIASGDELEPIGSSCPRSQVEDVVIVQGKLSDAQSLQAAQTQPSCQFAHLWHPKESLSGSILSRIPAQKAQEEELMTPHANISPRVGNQTRLQCTAPQSRRL